MGKFVVHFDGSLAHAVFDAAALQPYMVLVADFPFIFGIHFFAKESNNLLRLYAVYGFGLVSP